MVPNPVLNYEQVVSVCTTNNGAALAVGIWAVDKSQAIASNMKGKGIHIYQVYLRYHRLDELSLKPINTIIVEYS